jgi:hypothetical protein
MWLWDSRSTMDKAFPSWDDASKVLISRVGWGKSSPGSLPIILAGENGLIVVSAREGKLLASANFPQTTTSRPILAEAGEQGVADLLVLTADAVWGYKVVVRPGALFVFRLVVGLLLMAMMLAALRNRFGPTPGKRSTDA